MVCIKCKHKSPNTTNTCSLCGYYDPSVETPKIRDRWFTIFLYGMIGITILFIINNIGSIITNDEADGMTEVIRGFMVLKTVLYIIEIFIYVLLFKMKKKILKAYIAFLIVSAMINFFTFDVIPLMVKYVPVYWVFQSQWKNYK